MRTVLVTMGMTEVSIGASSTVNHMTGVSIKVLMSRHNPVTQRMAA